MRFAGDNGDDVLDVCILLSNSGNSPAARNVLLSRLVVSKTALTPHFALSDELRGVVCRQVTLECALFDPWSFLCARTSVIALPCRATLVATGDVSSSFHSQKPTTCSRKRFTNIRNFQEDALMHASDADSHRQPIFQLKNCTKHSHFMRKTHGKECPRKRAGAISTIPTILPRMNVSWICPKNPCKVARSSTLGSALAQNVAY